MNIQEIKKAIQNAEIALSANPDGRTKELLEIGLQAFNDMLLSEQLKKNQVQSLEKSEQLPTKTEMEEWAENIEQVQKSKQSNDERVLVATVTPSLVVQVPVVQITLRKEKMFERDGKRVKETFEIKEQMTKSEIMTMLKTYFKTLVNSENWKAGRYTEGKSGNMGFNVFELFKGWNAIHLITNEGDEYPQVNEVYPGYRHTSQDQRVGAELLHRWATKQQ